MKGYLQLKINDSWLSFDYLEGDNFDNPRKSMNGFGGAIGVDAPSDVFKGNYVLRLNKNPNEAQSQIDAIKQGYELTKNDNRLEFVHVEFQQLGNAGAGIKKEVGGSFMAIQGWKLNTLGFQQLASLSVALDFGEIDYEK